MLLSWAFRHSLWTGNCCLTRLQSWTHEPIPSRFRLIPVRLFRSPLLPTLKWNMRWVRAFPRSSTLFSNIRVNIPSFTQYRTLIQLRVFPRTWPPPQHKITFKSRQVTQQILANSAWKSKRNWKIMWYFWPIQQQWCPLRPSIRLICQVHSFTNQISKWIS